MEGILGMPGGLGRYWGTERGTGSSVWELGWCGLDWEHWEGAGGYWERLGGHWERIWGARRGILGALWGNWDDVGQTGRELEKLRGALGGNWVRYKRHWEVTGSTGAPQA